MKFKISKSEIHGNGVIATQEFLKGEIIGPAIFLTLEGAQITEELGRFINHSYRPNCRIEKNGLKYNLITIKSIRPNEELVVNYNDTPSFIERANPDFL